MHRHRDARSRGRSRGPNGNPFGSASHGCLGICFTSRDSLLSPKALQLGTAYALRRMGFSAPLSFERKQPIAREASVHVMSVMSVQLSDCEFFEIYLILSFEYSPFIWRILLGNLYFSPPPFLSCHSPWMVVQRGGWWGRFDLHAQGSALFPGPGFLKS